jgi:hypothetical protein
MKENRRNHAKFLPQYPRKTPIRIGCIWVQSWARDIQSMNTIYNNELLYRTDEGGAYSSPQKGKLIPVTGREGPCGCETSKLPHFLDSRLTDGGEVVSLTHGSSLYLQEDFWYSFLLVAESNPGPQCCWKD